ncbi:MAG: type I methionyl aminopeptidase [Candidatus Kerfeldbacteria bacterium]
MALIKTADEIAQLRAGGELLARGVEALLAAVRPGITTNELDAVFCASVKKSGGEPSFLNYRGYPRAVCLSVNDQVVHAIPGDRILENGDLLSVDCGLKYKGLYTDMARTVPVGEVSPEAMALLETTKESLRVALKEMVPGKTTGDIGAAIQQFAEAKGYSVVRALVGHGVGHAVHEEPSIPNFGKRGSGAPLKAGMVIAVEPMVNIGGSEVIIEDDGWTVRTADGTLSAHFEDTIVITDAQPEIVTTHAS